MYGAEPVSADLIRKQLQCLADDSPIHAIKTGALGNAAVVNVLVDFIDVNLAALLADTDEPPLLSLIPLISQSTSDFKLY